MKETQENMIAPGLWQSLAFDMMSKGWDGTTLEVLQ
jgi:hypothetical protein